MGMTRKDPGQLGPGDVGKVELGGFPTLENLRGFSASGPLYPIHPTIGPIGTTPDRPPWAAHINASR